MPFKDYFRQIRYGAAAIVGASLIASLVLNVITYVHMDDIRSKQESHTTVMPIPPKPTIPTISTSKPRSTSHQPTTGTTHIIPTTHEPEPTAAPSPTPEPEPTPGPTPEPEPTPGPTPEPEPTTTTTKRPWTTYPTRPPPPTRRTTTTTTTTATTTKRPWTTYPTRPPVPTRPTKPTTTTSPTPTPSPTTPPYSNDTVFCPNVGIANMSVEWKEAADNLLFGIDERFEPCEDFYSFTCNKFMEQVDLDKLGVSRFTTYTKEQQKVNEDIIEALNDVDIDDDKWSETERITKAAYQSCVDHSGKKSNKSAIELLEYIKKRFGGVPFLDHKPDSDLDLFEAIGYVEQERALGTFMSAWVTVDQKKITKNALYILQPTLPMPREFYVLPQFATELDNRSKAILKVMKKFAADVLVDPDKYQNLIKKAAQEVAKMEQKIAQATWPDKELSNYAQQYNKFDVETLNATYPNLNLKNYTRALVESVGSPLIKEVIITQPSYIGFLNILFAKHQWYKEKYINYLIVQMLFDEADYLGGDYLEEARRSAYVPYAQRHGHGVTRIGRRLSRQFDGKNEANLKCVDLLTTYMPFGTGYVYVKSRKNREETFNDVKLQTELVMEAFLKKMLSSLTWMEGSYQIAEKKTKEMHRNYGWPKELFGDFKNSTTIDNYHKQDYYPILEAYKKDRNSFSTILSILKKGKENRELFRLINIPADRTIFLLSPAAADAWYQHERNSLTIPYGILTPPQYKLGFPKYINFAGQAGTSGHELVHGFDDRGVQFAPDGSLSNCTSLECGWMDQKGKEGFRNMAQCLVEQYNTHCCPKKEDGSVLCVDGATVKGENIADLGGQQAAYYAYLKYIKQKGEEEKRLPGLEKFTPNQLFWIAYGYTWCAKETDSSLVKGMFLNPHAPNSCRTNQVLQNIPEFVKDFQCSNSQKMYRPPEERCKVWVE